MCQETLGSLNADFVIGRKTSDVQRYNVFNTVAKMHNNQAKWFEFQLQLPSLNEETTNFTKSSKKDDKDRIQMAMGVWLEKFNIVADNNLLEFFSFVIQDDNKFGIGKL